jgi:uncharacterized protein YdaU (DUF1376 family)
MLDWFPWYPMRFKAKTMHLSLAEDGLYRRLIDYYMETRSPLPDNHVALARIVGISLEEFDKIAPAILSLYFCHSAPNSYSHKMCDEILCDQFYASQKRSISGSIGAKKRWKNDIEIERENSTCHSNAIADPMAKNAILHNTTLHKKEKRKKVYRTLSEEKDFNEFWKAYPHHAGSKAEAAEIFQKLITEGENHEKIIHGAEKYNEFCISNRTERQYIAHATTWLNQRRWESDYTVSVPPGKAAAARAALDKSFEEMENDDWFRP